MYILIACSIVFAIDLVIKRFVENSFLLGQSVPVIPHFFHLTLVHNTGSAWGFFQGNNHLFTFLNFVAVAGCVGYFVWYGEKDALSRWVQGCVLGGAFSNLFDRLWYGYVIDYLDFRIWPVFNIADSCITVGLGFLLWKILRHKPRPAR